MLVGVYFFEMSLAGGSVFVKIHETVTIAKKEYCWDLRTNVSLFHFKWHLICGNWQERSGYLKLEY